jgi:hypothetical protein
MIKLERKQFEIDVANYADSYVQVLKSGMNRASAFADTSYIHSIIQELGQFSCLIRLECLNDMTMLHNDVGYARTMHESYESIGEYCYEMLKQAYDATNETLMHCNKLYYDLHSILQPEAIDISVATGYIAFNAFGNTAVLTLTNFKRMSGIGLCYDIQWQGRTIMTSNIQEQMSSKLKELQELAEVLRLLNDGGDFVDKIDAWSSIVNDKLVNAKIDAMAAWNATYNTYKKLWFNTEFTKQNAQIFCSLDIIKDKFVEAVCRQGKVHKIDYRQNHMQVLMLDYVNNANFDFL